MTRIQVHRAAAVGTPTLSVAEVFEAVSHRDDAAYRQQRLALEFGPTAHGTALALSEHLPDPAHHTARLAQAITEILAGIRPANQVSRLCSPEVIDLLGRRSRVMARQARPIRPARVRSVRVQQPAPGVIEAAVTVQHPELLRAMAMRLIAGPRSWVLTDLVVG